MSATESWGDPAGIQKHQAEVAKRPHYTVEVEALPLPRYPLVAGVPIEPVPIPLPRDCPTVEAALGNAGVLAQEGYRVKITGPEGVWDHCEVLRRLNAPHK
jgi:hypothetical protein